MKDIKLNISYIDDLIHRQNLSMRKTAKSIGLSPTGLRNALDKQSIRAVDLYKLAVFLGTSLEKMFDHESSVNEADEMDIDHRIGRLESIVDKLLVEVAVLPSSSKDSDNKNDVVLQELEDLGRRVLDLQRKIKE